MAKKFMVYELDFGDTNLLSENKQDILDWISTDIDNINEAYEKQLVYTISFRMMTRKQIEEIPEWA